MTPTHRFVLLPALLLSTAPSALMAQDAAPQASNPRPAPQMEMEDDEILVTGQAERGAVVGDIKPEQQLNAADIRAYGVSSVSELLNELAPQTNAASGPPVVLLNGKRIAGFQEIQEIPTEAIQRVDILPEQVALSYGYSANQKVVNIVLRQRFRAITGEARGGATTQADRANGMASANLLHIRGDNRLNIDLRYSAADSLLESDRGIISATPARPYALAGNVTGINGATQVDPALSVLAGQVVTIAAVPGSAAAGQPALGDFVTGANTQAISDVGDYRTLSPRTSNLALNATLARTLPGDISASLNGRIERTTSDSLRGLASTTLTLPAGNAFSPFSNPVLLYRYLADADALAQSVEGVNGHVGLTLNGQLKPWRWTFTGAYDLTDSRTRTDRSIDTSGLQAAINANTAGVNPFGTIASQYLSTRSADRAHARTSALSAEIQFGGPLFTLPAGKAMTSITIGASSNSFDSSAIRSGINSSVDFTRNIGSGQANIDLPIASRKTGFLSEIGDLGLNFTVAAQRLSDFGMLSTFGYGLRWTPIPQIRMIASMSQDRTAPTGQQVNNPLVNTPNVSVFDYARGETVFVTQVGGGISNLRASDRHMMRLNLTIKPFDKKDLSLTANFTHSKTDNPIASFPSPTPQIEAAFPGRFTRGPSELDENGNMRLGPLTQIDARPINYDESESTALRWGFNFSVPIKSSLQKKMEAWRAAGSKPADMPAEMQAMRDQFARARQQANGGEGQGDRPPQREGQDGAERQPGGENQGDRAPGGAGGDRPAGGFQGPGGFAGGGPRGPGPGAAGGAAGGGGRLQFALYHTWHIDERIRIAPGLPVLDLLNGGATGDSGGQPRHELQGQAGYSNNGLGARLSANWQSGTTVNGALTGTAGGTSSLRFSSLATADLRLFATFGQMPTLVKAVPFLRGARLSVEIKNIFDTRQDVQDATGATPVRYQPGYINPLGRTFSISFRKLFF